jgi:hypothetical protein
VWRRSAPAYIQEFIKDPSAGGSVNIGQTGRACMVLTRKSVARRSKPQEPAIKLDWLLTHSNPAIWEQFVAGIGLGVALERGRGSVLVGGSAVGPQI